MAHTSSHLQLRNRKYLRKYILILIVHIDYIIREIALKYRKSTVATNTDKLSNDEIEKLKSEEKEDLLSDMKLRFTNGEGSLSILKSYFPDKWYISFCEMSIRIHMIF